MKRRKFGKIPGSSTTRPPLQSTYTPYSDSQTSPYYPTPALNIEQRKTLLVDRMEHRILEEDINSKTGYTVLIAMTVFTSLVYRAMDLQYYLEERDAKINPFLYKAYDFSTWFLPSLPLWWLVMTTLLKHRSNFHRIQCYSLMNNAQFQVYVDWFTTILFVCFVLPIWILVGEMLWSLKMFPLGKHVTSKWWSLLSIIGIPNESDTTRSAHLKMNQIDITDLNHLPPSPQTPHSAQIQKILLLETLTPQTPSLPVTLAQLTPQLTQNRDYSSSTKMEKSSSKSSINRNPRRRRRILSENTPGEDAQIQKEKYMRRHYKNSLYHSSSSNIISSSSNKFLRNPKSLLNSIQKKAIVRRKKLAASMFGGSGKNNIFSQLLCIPMPRFDLTIDVASLNKMVLLELIFKYLPQFILQYMLNNETKGWTKSTITTCFISGLSLLYTAYGSYNIWKNGSWASDLPDLDQSFHKVRHWFANTFKKSMTVQQNVKMNTIKSKISKVHSTLEKTMVTQMIHDNEVLTPKSSFISNTPNSASSILRGRRALMTLSGNKISTGKRIGKRSLLQKQTPKTKAKMDASSSKRKEEETENVIPLNA
jgi:hypothetical protein